MKRLSFIFIFVFNTNNAAAITTAQCVDLFRALTPYGQSLARIYAQAQTPEVENVVSQFPTKFQTLFKKLGANDFENYLIGSVKFKSRKTGNEFLLYRDTNNTFNYISLIGGEVNFGYVENLESKEGTAFDDANGNLLEIRMSRNSMRNRLIIMSTTSGKTLDQIISKMDLPLIQLVFPFKNEIQSLFDTAEISDFSELLYPETLFGVTSEQTGDKFVVLRTQKKRFYYLTHRPEKLVGFFSNALAFSALPNIGRVADISEWKQGTRYKIDGRGTLRTRRTGGGRSVRSIWIEN